MNNKNILGILSQKIRKFIAFPVSDSKIEVILKILIKYDKKIDFNNEFSIKQFSFRSFLIFTKNIILKVYFNQDSFLCEFLPIKKLTEKKFDNIVKLIDYNEDNHILVLEKLELIYEDNKIKLKFANKNFIKNLLIVIFKSMYSLYIFNQQVNKDFSYKNIGIDKNNKIKVFDWELSCYINPENEYIAKEELYNSFKIFNDEFQILLENENLKDLKKSYLDFLKNFNKDLTDIRTVDRPTLSGKFKTYQFRAFKFIKFDSIINYIKRW